MIISFSYQSMFTRRIIIILTFIFLGLGATGSGFNNLGSNNCFGIQVDTLGDWPTFLGVRGDSRSDEKGISKDWSNGKLEILWSTDVGLGYSLGSMADGRFFQFDAIGNQSRLRCIDAKTGDPIWKFEYAFEYKDMFGFDNGPRTTPVVDGDRVYIYGVEGVLHCLNTQTGNVIWKKNISQDFGVVQNFFGVGSTPKILGKNLIVMVGGSPKEDQGSTRLDQIGNTGSAVVIFDKLTGQVLHQLGEDLASYSSIQTYDKNGKTFGVAWLRNQAIGFDIEVGKQLWKFPYRARKYESVNASSPVVIGEKIFLCESYGPASMLLDVGQAEPKVVWNDSDRRNLSLATHWNTPVYDEGFLYASHGENSSTAELRCVEFATGKVMWKKRGFGRCSLTYIDGHFVVVAERGQLFLIRATPDNFEVVTEYSGQDGEGAGLQYPCWSAAVIAQGKLYVRGKNKMICFQLTKD
ncbi:MAG: PQQ-binding-like beta-propeller repeat protein [Planctomycetota bacterium]